MAIEKNWDAFEISDNKKNKSVAIVGGGPTGLACAANLIQQGYQITIFEKHGELGGLLRHGIPEFRLNKVVLDKCIKNILKLGAKVEYGKELSKDFTLEDLSKKFDAVFLSFGANISRIMGIEGENLEGVFGANELLEYKNHPLYTGKKVAVIGGGNVAMDISRTVKRLGAKNVKVLYRRSQDEMPAEKKEIEAAINEGIEFVFKTNIIKLNGINKVESVECIKTELVKKQGQDRVIPVNVEGSEYEEKFDYVIMALGSHTENKILETLNLEEDSKGYIKVDDEYMTSRSGVFAGGDLIGTKATVAWAAKTGVDAAKSIINYLNK